MLYMAMPGTPLWKQMKTEGRLKEKFPWADIHGQHVQNWHHPHIPDEIITEKLDFAFKRDFEVLGPSILRGIQTQFDGYCNTADWDHELVQMRRKATRKKLFFYTVILDAMRRNLQSIGNATHEKARTLRDRIIEECGWKTKLGSKLVAPYVGYRLKKEQRAYERSIRLQKAPEPSCLVTHYGSFEPRFSPILPAPGPTPKSVAILRPQSEGSKERLIAMHPARPKPAHAPQVHVNEIGI
jgi:hypothetical protein